MLISDMNPEGMSREQLTKLLFQTDQLPGTGECIFVFGSWGRTAPKRVEKAVSLYLSGRAPYLLFSGGNRWPMGEPDKREADYMGEYALTLGAPDERILLEREAANTKENVLASLLILDRAIGLQNIRHILYVSAPFHMRRCLLTLRTYMPRWVSFSGYPDDRQEGQADNWWLTPKEEKKVTKEANSLVRYVRSGHLLDEDIEI